MAAEFLRTLGSPGTIQVIPRGHQHFARLTETAHDQAIFATGPCPHAQRQVEPFIQQIDAPIAGVNQQPDGRVAGKEFRQQRGQGILGERHGATEPDDAAGLRPGKFDCRHGRFGFTQHGRGVAIDFSADIRHDKTTGGAIDQSDVQSCFKITDVAGQP